MLVIKDIKKAGSYLSELKNLIQRAANDGVQLSISVIEPAETPILTSLVPELNITPAQIRVRTEITRVFLELPSLGHRGIGEVALEATTTDVHDYSLYQPNNPASAKHYTYVNTPGATHPVPEPEDMSRYYKQDPKHPVNWLSPSVTSEAAELTEFKLTKACCDVVDKFCNTDEWKGNLHAVITDAVSILIDRGTLKYIGG